MTELSDPTALSDAEREVLDRLAPAFLEALALREAGHVDRAEERLLDLLKVEPRLPEPRMELARILLDTDRVSEAEPHAREALRQLEAGGQWTDDLPEHVVTSMAHALVAEILRRRIEDDDVVFGDPETFRALVSEAKAHFQAAATLDPTDATASYYALFLGPQGREASSADA